MKHEHPLFGLQNDINYDIVNCPDTQIHAEIPTREKLTISCRNQIITWDSMTVMRTLSDELSSDPFYSRAHNHERQIAIS